MNHRSLENLQAEYFRWPRSLYAPCITTSTRNTLDMRTTYTLVFGVLVLRSLTAGSHSTLASRPTAEPRIRNGMSTGLIRCAQWPERGLRSKTLNCIGFVSRFETPRCPLDGTHTHKVNVTFAGGVEDAVRRFRDVSLISKGEKDTWMFAHLYVQSKAHWHGRLSHELPMRLGPRRALLISLASISIRVVVKFERTAAMFGKS
jgi:hypothetical protein